MEMKGYSTLPYPFPKIPVNKYVQKLYLLTLAAQFTWICMDFMDCRDCMDLYRLYGFVCIVCIVWICMDSYVLYSMDLYGLKCKSTNEIL